MSNSSANQVTVDGRLIGLVGLEEAVRKATASCKGKIYSEISDFLVREVSGRNYIPPSILPAYARALLREYKVALYLPVDPEPINGMTVPVINNRVVAVGEMPPKSSLRQWIIETFKSEDPPCDFLAARCSLLAAFSSHPSTLTADTADSKTCCARSAGSER